MAVESPAFIKDPRIFNWLIVNRDPEAISELYIFIIIGLTSLFTIILSISKKCKKKHIVMQSKQLRNYYCNVFNWVLNTRIYGDKKLSVALFYIIYTISNITFIIIGTPHMEDAVLSTGKFISISLFIQILLILKNSPLYWMTNLPYNALMVYHRWMGLYILLLSIVHTAVYISPYGDELYEGNTGINIMFFNINRTFGTISLILLVIIIICSYPYIRRKFYNTFLISHLLVIALYICIAIHRNNFLIWFVFIIMIYSLDKLIHLCSFTKALANVKVLNEVAILTFPRNIKFKVGQHIYLKIDNPKYKISKYELHPFTIASSNYEDVEIIIKNLGDYTKKITYIESPIELSISKPYGQYPFNYRRYKELIFIARGIGITPFLSILREISFFYENNIEFCIRKIVLAWVCKTHELITLLNPKFIEIQKKFAEQPNFYPELKLLFYTNDVYKTNDIFNEILRMPSIINVEYYENNIKNQILNNTDDSELIEIKFDDAIDNFHYPRRICVIGCGSSRLISEIWDAAHNYYDKCIQFDFYYETFEF